MGYYGLVVGALPTLLWLKALQAQTTSRAAILIYLTPALGLVWLKLLVPSSRSRCRCCAGLPSSSAGFYCNSANVHPTPPVAEVRALI